MKESDHDSNKHQTFYMMMIEFRVVTGYSSKVYYSKPSPQVTLQSHHSNLNVFGVFVQNWDPQQFLFNHALL